MKKMLLSFCAVVAAFCIGVAAEVPTIVVGPGESYVVGDVGAAQGGNGSHVYDLRGGSTLVITNCAAGGGTFWNVIYATNGLATVDCTQMGGKVLTIMRGVRSYGRGAVRVKSANSYVKVSQETTPCIWDAEDFQVLKTDGTPWPDGGSLQLMSKAAVLHAPTNCLLSLAGTTFVAGEGPAFAGSRIVVPNGKNLVVCGSGKIGPDQTVEVEDGGTLTLRSVGIRASSVMSNQIEFYDENASSFEADFPVCLAGETSDMTFASGLTATVGGPVTGKGMLTVPETADVTVATDLQKVTARGEANSSLTLAAGVAVSAYTALASTARLEVGKGAHVRVIGDVAFPLTNRGGSVEAGGWTWQEKVGHWFDPSCTDLYRCIGYYDRETPGRYQPDAKNGSYPYVEQLFDCRDPSASVSLFNHRAYDDKSHVTSVYPYVVPYGKNGLSYLGFAGGGNIRLPFGCDSALNQYVTVSATLVTMVFGSQNGGGTAVIGTTDGSFARAGTTVAAGITTNTAHAIWVDGVKLSDPTAGNVLNKGWQIISIDARGLPFKGIGMAKGDSPSGGQNYGEILIFTKPVSEADRIEAERYLAQKWGIDYAEQPGDLSEYKMNSCTNTLAAYGSGLVVVSNGTARLNGQSPSQVELSDGRLIVGPPPPGAESVPTENLVWWCDPEVLDAAIVSTDKLDHVRIYGLPDRREGGFAVGKNFLWGAGGRQPWIDRSAHGDGPVRNWIDFSEPLAPTAQEDLSGNNLRFVKYEEGMNVAGMSSATLSGVSLKTGFVVSDSSRGGGSPILSAVAGTAGHFQARAVNLESAAAQVADAVNALASYPIWPEVAGSDYLRRGVTRLNGLAVDYRDGFTGGPELLSFQPAGTVTANVFALYNTGEANAERTGRKGTSFESLGEMLFYSTALDAADVSLIESYLMYKWLGKVQPDGADLTQVTVSGKGEVVADSFARLPRLADDFSGKLTVSGLDEGVLTVTIDPLTDLVDGAIILPDVVMSLPERVSVVIRFTSRPSRLVSHVWRIVTASGFAHPVDWSCSFEGFAPKGASLTEDGQGIALTLPSTGLMLIVR